MTLPESTPPTPPPPTPKPMIDGAVLRRVRTARGMSREALLFAMHRAGVENPPSLQTLGRIEKAAGPRVLRDSPGAIEAIAQILDTPLEALLAGKASFPYREAT